MVISFLERADKTVGEMLKDDIVDEISRMLLVVHWWYLFLSVLQTLLVKRDNALQRIINMLMFSCTS